MKLIITKNYEEMSQITAQIVLSKMYTEKRVNLSLTGGATPKRMYEILAEYMPGRTYYNNAHFYNFDEIELTNERYGFTMRTLAEQFYNPCKITKDNIHELNANNYEGYDEVLLKDGGLDLVLMGIGADGHFCGNLPEYTSFENKTNLVTMTETDPNYKILHDLIGIKPTGRAVTFGPKTIMAAKQLVLFANGQHKADIIKAALEGPVTDKVPSSLLKLHNNLIVVLDEDAAAKLTL